MPFNNFIRGVATQIASNALRSVSSKLPGLNLSYNPGRSSSGSDTSDFASLQPFSESKNYTFPLDVEAGPGLGNQGHYIMFYINQQQKATLSFGKGGGAKIGGLNTNINVPNFLKLINPNGKYTRRANKSAVQNQHNKDHPNSKKELSVAEQYAMYGAGNATYGSAGRESVFQNWYRKNRSTVAIKRAPTRKLDTAIAMFMPANVTTTYGAQYTDTEIGAVTEEAIAAYEKFARGNIEEGMNEIRRMSGDLSDSLGALMLNTIGALPGFAGVKEASEMRSGVILSDRMELAFKGIDKRKFEYEFKMIPKSEKEAQAIRNIIFAFKSAMMPEFEGGNLSGRKLIVPNTFDIEYMWNGNQNQFINKISECVLTNMSVSYGGDRYKTHDGIEGDGAPPIETTISLSFSELELITREKIHEGF